MFTRFVVASVLLTATLAAASFGQGGPPGGGGPPEPPVRGVKIKSAQYIVAQSGIARWTHMFPTNIDYGPPLGKQVTEVIYRLYEDSGTVDANGKPIPVNGSDGQPAIIQQKSYTVPGGHIGPFGGNVNVQDSRTNISSSVSFLVEVVVKWDGGSATELAKPVRTP